MPQTFVVYTPPTLIYGKRPLLRIIVELMGNIRIFPTSYFMCRSNRSAGFFSPDHCRTPVLYKPEESLYSDIQVKLFVWRVF